MPPSLIAGIQSTWMLRLRHKRTRRWKRKAASRRRMREGPDTKHPRVTKAHPRMVFYGG